MVAKTVPEYWKNIPPSVCAAIKDMRNCIKDLTTFSMGNGDSINKVSNEIGSQDDRVDHKLLDINRDVQRLLKHLEGKI